MVNGERGSCETLWNGVKSLSIVRKRMETLPKAIWVTRDSAMRQGTNSIAPSQAFNSLSAKISWRFILRKTSSNTHLANPHHELTVALASLGLKKKPNVKLLCVRCFAFARFLVDQNLSHSLATTPTQEQKRPGPSNVMQICLPHHIFDMQIDLASRFVDVEKNTPNANHRFVFLVSAPQVFFNRDQKITTQWMQFGREKLQTNTNQKKMFNDRLASSKFKTNAWLLRLNLDFSSGA